MAPVTFVRRRVRVYWGGWSQVEATLRLMQCAMTKDRTLARFALISGACYPLKSNETLRDYLLCDEREHISAFPMPDGARDKPLTRLTRWHLQRGLRGTGIGARAARLVNDALRVLPPRRLAGLVPYAGSSWFVLTRDAVATILERVETDRRFVSFFRYSHCPDESFFQTLLASSALRERIAGSLTFADWSPCIEQPSLIREDHLPRLLDGSQELFFARKFSSRNAHLLDRIDAARGTAAVRTDARRGGGCGSRAGLRGTPGGVVAPLSSPARVSLTLKLSPAAVALRGSPFGLAPQGDVPTAAVASSRGASGAGLEGWRSARFKLGRFRSKSSKPRRG